MCDQRIRTRAAARHLGLDAVRLGGAALLHGGHHLHLRPLFRLAHGERPGRRAGGLGLRHRRRRLRHRHPVAGARLDRRPDRAAQAVDRLLRGRSRSSVAVAAVVRRARLEPVLVPSLFFSLASVAAEFSTVFNDSMMPRLVSKAEIGRMSNIAWGLGYLGGMIVLIFVVALPGRLAGDRQDDLGVDPLFGLDPASSARMRAPPGRCRRCGISSSSCRCSCSRRTPSKGMPIGPAVRDGLAELQVDARRGAPAQRHLALPDRPHDLSGRRQRAAGARRRLRGGDVRLVDHRDRHLRHHPQRRRDLRLPGRQPARHRARLEDAWC